MWTIVDSDTRVLVRIDPQTNQATATLTFPRAIYSLTIADGSVWTDSGDGNAIYRIDLRAMQ